MTGNQDWWAERLRGYAVPSDPPPQKTDSTENPKTVTKAPGIERVTSWPTTPQQRKIARDLVLSVFEGKDTDDGTATA